MNITLRDLLRWPETRLRPVRLGSAQSSVLGPQSSSEAALLHPDHEVSWPVTMRATPPMLPHVDAGALVLLPAATLAEVGPGLPGALRELKRRGVAALVVDLDAAVEAGDLDLLCSPEPVNAELEAALARVVNARRARLYRRGTELDRALTEATLHGRGLSRLLAIGATQGGRDVLLLDERGRIGEAAGPSGEWPGGEVPRPPPPLGVDAPLAPIPDAAGGVEWFVAPLGGAATGWIAVRGPLGELDEGDRLLAQRVAAACALALVRREGARAVERLSPARRAALTADLLRRDLPPAARAADAEALGLDPAVAYAVLLIGPPTAASGPAAQGRAVHAARRLLASQLARVGPGAGAEPFEDGPTGAVGLLLHAPDPDDLRRGGLVLRGALAREGAPVAGALSETAPDLEHAPSAARQARFALALLRDGALPGLPVPLLDWTSPDELGPYALLYPLWGTPAATRFVEAVLGELPAYDARYGGELLPTLATYLEHGGAAGVAADRLAIHRNTLTYRLRRIAELTGRSALDPAQQLSLRLAVMLHRLPSPDELGGD